MTLAHRLLELLKKLQQDRGLFARVFRGGAWLGMGSVSEQGLRFVRNMILTRILAPEAFGIMAIVLSVCSLFQVLTGIGIKEAVIQHPQGADRTYLNGAWWLNAGRGLGLYLLALVLAPFIATFYEAPELTALLRIAFVNVLAQGLISAGAFVAVKQMRYSRWVFINQGGACIGVVTTILLALQIKGPLALVIGFATEGVARCLLSYAITPFRPGFQFNRAHWHSLLRFARGMFGLPALMLIYSEGATFMLGKLVPKEALGLYAMALTIARAASMFSGVVSDLLIPAFSTLQAQRERINRNLLKITTILALLGLPAIAFVALHGNLILTVLYGPAYGAGAACLAILFINEFLISCCMPITSVYMAVGQPRLIRNYSIARAIVMAALLYPAIKLWGLVGGALCPLVSMFVAYGFQLAKIRTVTGLNLGEYGTVFLRSLPLAVPMLLVGALSFSQNLSLKPAWRLGVALALAAVLYGGVALFLSRRAKWRQFYWPFVPPNPAV